MNVESLPQLLIHVGAVLDFLCVFENGSVSMQTGGVTGVSDLEGSAGVHEHKQCKLRATSYAAEHILVEEEVGSEENDQSLKVDHFGERRSWHESGLGGVHLSN